MLRRRFRGRGEEAVYRFGPLEVDILGHVVTRYGEPIRLAPTTFEILSLLVRNVGRLVPYQQFIDPPNGKYCLHQHAGIAHRYSRVARENRKRPLQPENDCERRGVRLSPRQIPCWRRATKRIEIEEFGYTCLQIALHWLVAALALAQYATSGAIVRTRGIHLIGQRPNPTELVLPVYSASGWGS
jgi:hypothetical protein